MTNVPALRREKATQGLLRIYAERKLEYKPLTDDNEKFACYLGSKKDLVNHMKETGMRTLSTQQALAWLRSEDHIPSRAFKRALAHLGLDLNDASGFQIEHIWPPVWGGPDHPCNYYLTPKPVNGSWFTHHKLVWMGKETAKIVKERLRTHKSESKHLNRVHEF